MSEASLAMTLTDTQVWEAFRSLPLEGEDLFARIRRHFTETAFFGLAGPTLEVGSGDGFLWQGDGEPVLPLALSRGSLTLTDVDPERVAACRATALATCPSVVIEEADVLRLPYETGRFARVLAVQVLHWCDTPEALRTAIAELARVTHPQGRALVVTVDANVHMAEVYSLMHQANARLTARGIPLRVEIPSHPPRVARFCAANAQSCLQAAFGEVRRIDCNYAHRVEHAHPLLPISGAELVAKYVGSAPFLRNVDDPTRVEAFLDEAQRLVAATIENSGVFRVSRRDVLFECMGPR